MNKYTSDKFSSDNFSAPPTPSVEDNHDTLESLLSKDAQAYPIDSAIIHSEWFAARTAAIALHTPQKNYLGGFDLTQLFSFFLNPARWWKPAPLAGISVAGVAALSFMLMQHGTLKTNPPSSANAVMASTSETEFEQHIELIADNSDFTQ